MGMLDNISSQILSTFTWSLGYGSFAYLVSNTVRKAMWRHNKRVQIFLGFTFFSLTIGIVIGGFVITKKEQQNNKVLESVIRESKNNKVHSQEEAVSTLNMSRLFVKTIPSWSRVRIMNIRPMFYQGIELSPGRYNLEISAKGYKTKRFWIKLDTGKKTTIKSELKPVQEVSKSTTKTVPKQNLSLTKKPSSKPELDVPKKKQYKEGAEKDSKDEGTDSTEIVKSKEETSHLIPLPKDYKSTEKKEPESSAKTTQEEGKNNLIIPLPKEW
jgi:hypothetical protein